MMREFKLNNRYLCDEREKTQMFISFLNFKKKYSFVIIRLIFFFLLNLSLLLSIACNPSSSGSTKPSPQCKTRIKMNLNSADESFGLTQNQVYIGHSKILNISLEPAPTIHERISIVAENLNSTNPKSLFHSSLGNNFILTPNSSESFPIYFFKKNSTDSFPTKENFRIRIEIDEFSHTEVKYCDSIFEMEVLPFSPGSTPTSTNLELDLSSLEYDQVSDSNTLISYVGESLTLLPMLPDAIQNSDERNSLTYSYSATGLPSGLKIDATSGVIYGNLESAGSSDINITAQVSLGSNSSTKNISFTIDTKTLDYSNIEQISGVKTAIDSIEFMIDHNIPNNFVFVLDNLPRGLSLDNMKNIIGTPQEMGSFNSSIEIYQNKKQILRKELYLNIWGDVIPKENQTGVPINQEVVFFIGDSRNPLDRTRDFDLELQDTADDSIIDTEIISTLSNKIILQAQADLSKDSTYKVMLVHEDDTKTDLLTFSTTNATHAKRGDFTSMSPASGSNASQSRYTAENLHNLVDLLSNCYRNRNQYRNFVDSPFINQIVDYCVELREILGYVGFSSYSSIQNELPYSVQFHEINYNTVDPQGKQVVVSALVAVPISTETLTSPDYTIPDDIPLMIYQHGTISNDRDAPSNSFVECIRIPKTNGLYSELEIRQTNCSLLNFNFAPSILFVSLFAAKGYLVVAPDYIGYGTSSKISHPYIHADSTASSVVDAIRAVRGAQTSLNLELNTKEVMVGYSEGGFATIAARQMIEERYDTEFQIEKTIAGAGPYALEESIRQFYLIQNSSLSTNTFALLDSAFLAFKSSYDDILGSVLNSSIVPLNTNKTSFQNTFINDYNAQSDASHILLRQIWDLNSVYRWHPNRGSILLIHGANDRTVPVLNTNIAYDYFTSSENSNRANIKKDTTCNESDDAHISCVGYYVRKILENL